MGRTDALGVRDCLTSAAFLVQRKKEETVRDRWQKIGVVGVDSGRLLITDYPEEPSVQWDAIVKQLEEKNYPMTLQLMFAIGTPGAGVTVATGIGDGIYDVEAKIGPVEIGGHDMGERVKELRIKFMPHPAIRTKKDIDTVFGKPVDIVSQKRRARK